MKLQKCPFGQKSIVVNVKVPDEIEVNIHLRGNIFASTNFCKCSGLDISCVFIFSNQREFRSEYTK